MLSGSARRQARPPIRRGRHCSFIGLLASRWVTLQPSSRSFFTEYAAEKARFSTASRTICVLNVPAPPLSLRRHVYAAMSHATPHLMIAATATPTPRFRQQLATYRIPRMPFASIAITDSQLVTTWYAASGLYFSAIASVWCFHRRFASVAADLPVPASNECTKTQCYASYYNV